MKSLITLAQILFVSVLGYSQITEQQVSGAFGTQNAFVIEHQGATAKHAEEAWKAFAKQYSKKTKFNRKSNTWETTGAKMATVSSKNLDLYMKVAEGNGMTRTSVFFDNGMVFLDSSNSADVIADINSMLEQYQAMTKTLVIEDELKAEEGNLKSLEKSLDKLKKENQKYHDQIAEYENKIAEAEDAIITNMQDQKSAENSISEQQGLIEMVKEKLNATRVK